jgi:superfamily II DNA or RNA helicase
VHSLPAESYLRVSQATPNAYWRFGFSGTPLARGDRRSVLAIGALGRVVYRVKPDVLIEAGVLARPRIRMVPILQLSARPTWQGVYGELVVRSRQRNAAVVAAVRAADKPCLVFVRELAHGRVLEKALAKAGVSASFVSGQHSTEWRRSHVRRLERGHFDALVSTVVFQEGVDIPDLRSVVVACGGASVIAALQRIGRAMRVAPGKDSCEVVDFKDLGHPWMERHSRARLAAYVKEGHEVVEAEPAVGSAA